jgi:hypothetical protein
MTSYHGHITTIGKTYEMKEEDEDVFTFIDDQENNAFLYKKDLKTWFTKKKKAAK